VVARAGRGRRAAGWSGVWGRARGCLRKTDNWRFPRPLRSGRRTGLARRPWSVTQRSGSSIGHSVPSKLKNLEELSLKSKITKLIAIASSLAALIVAGSASIKIG